MFGRLNSCLPVSRLIDSYNVPCRKLHYLINYKLTINQSLHSNWSYNGDIKWTVCLCCVSFQKQRYQCHFSILIRRVTHNLIWIYDGLQIRSPETGRCGHASPEGWETIRMRSCKCSSFKIHASTLNISALKMVILTDFPLKFYVFTYVHNNNFLLLVS